MSNPTVVLHIGAMKTGTSFVQSVLNSNAERLASHGILWPGDVRSYQRHAVNDLLGTRGESATTGQWDELVGRVLAHDGTLAIVSMEFLSFASAEVVERAMASLRPAHVRVVLGARDLARSIPAQWQESTLNRHSWTYASYVKGLVAHPDPESKAGRHFWTRHDWAEILRRWKPHVGADELRMMTLPPRGAASDTLWARFCEAAELNVAGLDVRGAGNESLGAASAEVMRQVSALAQQRGMTREEFEPLRTVLGKQVLAARRGREPELVVPEQYRPIVEQRSANLVEQVREVGPRIVGDLDDLLPRWSVDDPAKTTSAPRSLDQQVLVDAAVEGLIGLAARTRDP